MRQAQWPFNDMFFRSQPIALTKERTGHVGAKYHNRGRPNTVIVRLHVSVFFVYLQYHSWGATPHDKSSASTVEKTTR